MPARELFWKSKTLNVFETFNNFVFMLKITSQTAPKIFQNKFRKPTHKYPTSFFAYKYSILQIKLIKKC